MHVIALVVNGVMIYDKTVSYDFNKIGLLPKYKTKKKKNNFIPCILHIAV